MRINPSRSAVQAVTLVEVVIAVAIVSIAGAGLMNALGYGFMLTQTVRENQRATQILLEKVETLRLYNWEQVNSNGFIPSTFTAVYDPQGTNGSQGTIYYGTVGIGSFPGSMSYGTNLRQVVITLNWTNRQPHTRRLATAIARDGEQNYVW